MKKIRKILIANRGEIVIRVCRTLRKMNIEPVLIYSESDRESWFLDFAVEKYLLKGETLSETYLDINQIIDIAKKSNCDAIHPGYGFLSENSEFALEVEKAGLIFIGPDSDVISDMGNKLNARKIAEDAGVPVIFAVEGKPDEIIKKSEQMEFPVLVKAAAGGGGKGMRLVYEKSNLEDEINSCFREAQNAFGDGTVYVEKYFPEARHIEVQILADKSGKTVHLFERECSVQRRYQKIIEEAPSVTLNENLRKKICEAAVKIAEKIEYVSAGTVEFLLDSNDNFYFLEMNTRIQVEHPVTEMTIGIDIVEEQIKIAEEKPLELKQEDIIQKGHAIECRIYAEDPDNNFLPSPGTITYYEEPEKNENVRLDSSLNSEAVISPDFDPMIAKLICYAKTRSEAIEEMSDTLNQYKIAGIKTNVNYLKKILKDDDFVKNKIHTKYCEQKKELLLNDDESELTEEQISVSIAGVIANTFIAKSKSKNLWQKIGRWREVNILKFKIHKREIFAEYRENHKTGFEFEISGKLYKCSEINSDKRKISFLLNDKFYEVISIHKTDRLIILYENQEILINRFDYLNETKQINVSENETDEKVIYPNMPGKVMDIFVNNGDEVKKGENLLVLEAMKMETVIRSPFDCVIEKVNCEKGELVRTDIPVIIIGEK